VVAEAHQKTAEQVALFQKESKRRHEQLSATAVDVGGERVDMAHETIGEMQQELNEACSVKKWSRPLEDDLRCKESHAL